MNPQSKVKPFTIAYTGIEYGRTRRMIELLAKELSEEIFKGVKDFKILIADSESKEKLDKAVEALKVISQYTSAYSGASSPEANLAKETLLELGIE